MAMKISDVELQIAAQLRVECGVTVEFTFRDDDQFTVSGKPSEVQKAASHLQASPYNWVPDGDPQYDDELDEQFVYLRKP